MAAVAQPATPKPVRLIAFEQARLTHVIPMAEWIEKNYPDLTSVARRLRHCANVLQFRQQPGGRNRLVHGMFCHQTRLCAVCAMVHAARYAYHFTDRMAVALHQHPDLTAYHVTLTLKSAPGLSGTVRHLLDCAGRLHRRGQKFRREGRGGFTEAARAVGAMRSAEIHWSYDSYRVRRPLVWNVHSHEVWLCDGHPDANRLSAEWVKITGGSWKVSVEPLHAHRLVADPATLPAALLADAQRLFRYTRKLEAVPLLVRWKTHTALAGATGRAPRLVATYGCLRGSLPDLSTPPDEAEQDTIHRVFAWKGTGYFKCG